MKRLYACIGFTMFITFTVVFYFELWGCAAVCIGSLALSLSALFFRKFRDYRKAMIFIAVVAMLSNIYSFAFTEFVYEPKSTEYLNEVVDIEAEVVDIQSKTFYQVDTISVNGEEEKLKLMLYSPQELDVEYKDIIRCRVMLSECDYPVYKSRKIMYMARSEDYYLNCEITHVENKGLMYIPVQIRKALIHSIKTLIPGAQGELCSAVTVGDKSGISDDVYNDFEDTGLLHIVVVSGMHMTVLVSFILCLMSGLPQLTRYNILRFIVSVSVILLFVSVTGFSNSAVRSAVMMTIFVLGKTVRRQYDGLNSLGFAAMVQTAVNPYIIADVGMLLSYGAVLGIVLIYPVLNSWLMSKNSVKELIAFSKPDKIIKQFRLRVRKLILRVADALLLSLSACVFVMPITAIFFESITPASVILTCLVTVAVDVMLILGLLFSILWYVAPLSFLAYPLAFISYYLAGYVLFVMNAGKFLGLTGFYVNSQVFILCYAFVFAMFVFAYHSKNRKKNLKFAAFLSVVMILTLSLASAVIRNDTLTLKVHPSGEGLTVTFQHNNFLSVLSCGGDKIYTDDVTTSIHRISGDVDLLLIPSASNKEARYADDIITEFDVSHIMLYYMSSTRESTYELAQTGDSFRSFTKDDSYTFKLTEGIRDEVINVNNHTYQYIHSDKSSVLIIPSRGNCREIPEKYRSADCVIISQEPKNFDLVSYGELIWSSDKTLPESIENARIVEEKSIEISLKQ